jgi:subtilisin family serine protease
VIAVANESLASLPSGVYGAPGDDVPTTQPGGKWYLVNGSSFAAAHVSGLIALVREEHRGSSRSALVAARPTGGTVDACATVLRVSAECDCSCAIAGHRSGARR